MRDRDRQAEAERETDVGGGGGERWRGGEGRLKQGGRSTYSALQLESYHPL